MLRTGCRWQDLPREYSAHVTAWRRLRRWEEDGAWERIVPVYRGFFTLALIQLWVREAVIREVRVGVQIRQLASQGKRLLRNAGGTV